MFSSLRRLSGKLPSIVLSLLMLFAPMSSVLAQNEVTGAFAGRVSEQNTDKAVPNATVRFINQLTQVPVAKKTNNNGEFYQGLLQPGRYTIIIMADGYKTKTLRDQLLVATRPNTVQPLPVTLELDVVATQPTETKPDTTKPPTTTPPPPIDVTTPTPIRDSVDIKAELDASDARRGGTFVEGLVFTLPLGGVTFNRSFDELALLTPGVALAPQTQGGVAGPGVGAGVGSAGQFAVNGLRSRANNFTVDGSDNNDEDIGVRRQGFFSLVPQSIESVREYQIITALAPAQFGRNLAAQVNAISKTGGDKIHGALYGFLNTSDLNARDVFDQKGLNGTTPLRVGNDLVVRCPNINCAGGVGTTPITTSINTGEKDSLTYGQFGAAIGGPFPRFGEGGPVAYKNTFYFLSAEGQIFNAVRQADFAVPTVAQRGSFGTGATGITQNPLPLPGQPTAVNAFPTTLGGDAIFSLFPFPNNPGGVYGANTFTRVLPASAQGTIASAKFDKNFQAGQRQHDFAVRYNFTEDERIIPVTGGALFSGLRPTVRTQNVSTVLNSELSGPNAVHTFFNQFRVSYGRTRLNFDEKRDTEFLLPISGANDPRFSPLEREPFFLNAPYLVNYKFPGATPGLIPYSNGFRFTRQDGTIVTQGTTQDRIGPVGQVIVAGFSPIGVDVFNFPQDRVNNTYQIADSVSGRIRTHSLAFGADVRRTELNSRLPRNSRPLLTFYGAPRMIILPGGIDPNGIPNRFRFAVPGTDPTPFIRPEDFAAANATSGSFLSIANGADSVIHLRYYQVNGFIQDEWRIRPNFSLSFGVRYEYNTPPSETDRKIERTFNDQSLTLLPGLRDFIGNRRKIYDADWNNFAPRVSFAYSPEIFGPRRTSVFRAGYGLYYDQILGAVVSQSRNVFPSFLTANFGGGIDPLGLQGIGYDIFNPLNAFVRIAPSPNFVPVVVPTTGNPNALNPTLTPSGLVPLFNAVFGNAFGVTLPAKRLNMPRAHHYLFTFEQQISASHVLSVSYVGTYGQNLLRLATPNLGQNYILGPLGFFAGGGVPIFAGVRLQPGQNLDASGAVVGGRPTAGIGPVNIYETTAKSRYDSVQAQLRGRYLDAFQYQIGYVFSKALDDVSDVFDLAGAPALPQNSRSFAGERAVANFHTPHRVTYNFVYSFPTFANRSATMRALAGGLQVASTGQYQTGQPFTVNSIFDVNLDGNLTDRPNTTTGLTVGNNNRQPLRLIGDPVALLARPGGDGAVGRNTFRSGDYLLINLAVIKDFVINESQRVTFRTEIFNLPNFANYGIPVRFLEAPGFGQATETVTPGRRIQFALKYIF